VLSKEEKRVSLNWSRVWWSFPFHRHRLRKVEFEELNERDEVKETTGEDGRDESR
jgi:hypothetical protein